MINNKNKGQITVFACAMLCVCLLLLLTVLQCIRSWEGDAKGGQAVAAAADSIKGDFQPELFRRYHLLALDKTYYGRGEGYLEERAKEYLEYNLNPEQGLYQFQIEDVMLADTKDFIEDDLYGARQQIQAYMEQKYPIALFEQVQKRIENSQPEQQASSFDTGSLTKGVETDNREDGIDDPTEEQLRMSGLEEVLQDQEKETAGEWTLADLMELNLEEQGWLDDPQVTLESLLKADKLRLVMPDLGMSVSNKQMPTAELPSKTTGEHTEGELWYENNKIQSVSDLTMFLSNKTFDSTIDSTIDSTSAKEELYGITYALDSFSYLGRGEETEEGKTGEDYHALVYEVEYMIAGQNSDYKNLNQIAEELCLLRLLPNAAYAFTDSDMKDTALLVSTLLLAPVGMAGAAKPVSYVVLACWAYAESILDVRCLFQGDTVPFVKTKDTWQLSLNQIKNLAKEEVSGCKREEGLCYEDYLVFLLAAMPDQDLKYYRMLDIMQMNLQEQHPQFQIDHCVYDFCLQAKLQENHNIWFYEERKSYLP